MADIMSSHGSASVVGLLSGVQASFPENLQVTVTDFKVNELSVADLQTWRVVASVCPPGLSTLPHLLGLRQPLCSPTPCSQFHTCISLDRSPKHITPREDLSAHLLKNVQVQIHEASL